MRARIEEPDPFQVGDRVKTFVGSFASKAWCHGTIVSIRDNVAVVHFDDLVGMPSIALQDLAWRVERLEYETKHTPDDYFM